MINVSKSLQVPPSLAIEKAKPSSENYRGNDVLAQLKDDFNSKCYICEDKEPSTLNVEHFKPHRGDRHLMFSWPNLFLACGHFNNTKGDKPNFDNLLNCTSKAYIITDQIKFFIKPWPFEKAEITPLVNLPEIHNTVTLIEQVYNGVTGLKTIEAEFIVNRLIEEMLRFTKKLNSFFIVTNTQKQKNKIEDDIRRMLDVTSPFTAFKIWVIKDNTRLMNEFGKYLP